MPLSLTTLSLVALPVSMAEGLKILERDDYCCKYCGLDGRASFENALVMRVDFVHPRARKGKKDPKQPGRLLFSLQHHQRHKGLRQLRRSENLRPQTSRRSAQSLAIQDRAPDFETSQRVKRTQSAGRSSLGF